jgi:drug/metabolite transporter (DMT)-like permease
VTAAGVTYIPPVPALLLGVFLASDTINPASYAAMVFILAGVAIMQFGSREVPNNGHAPAKKKLRVCLSIR